jgi:hypothetical protein
MSKRVWNQIPNAYVCNICFAEFKAGERLARCVDWTPSQAANDWRHVPPDLDLCKSHKDTTTDESYSEAARSAAWLNLDDDQEHDEEGGEQ